MKRILFIFISIPLLLFGAASLVYAQETSDYSKLTTEDYTNISLPPTRPSVRKCQRRTDL